MPEQEQKKDYLELFDVSENSVIGTVPIDRVKHVPRIGERIFLPLHQPGEWAEFKIVDIEYFLSTSESCPRCHPALPMDLPKSRPDRFRSISPICAARDPLRVHV
jgi:hypothetical protein